jgi:hypothetical protein
MTAGLRYFLKTTHFATDMLALADLINVRFHASQNVDGARLDEQLAQFRLLQALGRLKPTLETAYSQ